MTGEHHRRVNDLRLRIGVLMLLIAATITSLPGTVDPAGAQTGAFACNVIASPSGFEVTWVPGEWVNGSTAEADRFVVDRQVYRRFHWRGRTDASATSFSDSGTPTNVAEVRYRVAAQRGSAVLERVECNVVDSSGFECVQDQTNDGSFEISWSSSVARDSAAAVDFVVRRAVSPDGPSYWRARTEAASLSDGASPTGVADYQVLMRFDRRVVAATNCTDSSVPPPPPPPPPPACEATRPLGSERPAFSVGPVFADGSLYFRTGDDTPQLTDQLVQIDPAATDTTVLGTMPGSFASPWFVESDGSVVVSARTDEFGDELWRFDRPTATFELLADLNPGPASSFPNAVSLTRGPALITANDGSGFERLYEYDEATQTLEEVEELRGLGLRTLDVLAEGPGDFVYLGGRDDRSNYPLIAWNRATNTFRTYDFDDVHQVVTGPDGLVYFSGSRSFLDDGLWQLDPLTGEVVKVVPTNDGRSVETLRSGPGSLLLYSVVDERGFGQLWAFDTTTGLPIDIDNPSSVSPSTPVIGSDGRAYVVSSRGELSTTLWAWDPASGVTSVIGGDDLGIETEGIDRFYLSGNGTLILIDQADGRLVVVDPSCLDR